MLRLDGFGAKVWFDAKVFVLMQKPMALHTKSDLDTYRIMCRLADSPMARFGTSVESLRGFSVSQD